MDTERVLIASADSRTNQVLVYKLTNAGYRVHTAVSGEEVVEKTLSIQPDLILLSIALPDKDGFEVCAELRQNPLTRRTPVIALLDADLELQELAEKGLRFDGKIVKPFNPQDALLMVHGLMDKRSSMKTVNRLTGLPEKIQYEEEIRERFELGVLFHLLFVDIEYFTIYNKYYGFDAGDEVIKATARILEEVVASLDTDDVFLAHLGGDNFRILLPLGYGERVGREIIKKFDEGVGQFYMEHDRERGGIVVKNRRGALEQWPLMTIAVAQVSNEFRTFRHPLEMELVGDELLMYAKTMPGSNFVYDRRRDPDKVESKNEQPKNEQ